MKSKKPSKAIAIVALLLNVLLLPGLGSIVGGRVSTGLIQLVLFIIGIPLSYIFGIGIPLVIAVWIWALITGIHLINESE